MNLDEKQTADLRERVKPLIEFAREHGVAIHCHIELSDLDNDNPVYNFDAWDPAKD